MQIVANTTGMEAGLALAADKDARDHCVVVVKGTFQADAQGALSLAAKQRPLVEADEHYGDPSTTCIRYENDFALEKPLTDVLVVGKGVAPRGQPVTQLPVRLDVNGRTKDILVIGNRRWQSSLVRGSFPSEPEPFTEMPLTFDRAFGGQDDSKGPAKLAVEQRNLVGVSFHPHRPTSQAVGMPLPNLERIRSRITSLRDRPEPVGLGCVGRNWKPRVEYAGTYDQRWLDTVCPFLPADSDNRYYQSAPADQQFPRFKGGEVIRCIQMAATPVVAYRIPSLEVPVRFGFVDGDVERRAVLDTVILEPHLSLAMLVWRASVPLGKKLNALRTISVGEPPKRPHDPARDPRSGKPRFQGLDMAIRWLHNRRGGMA